jgi:hypothetical protein
LPVCANANVLESANAVANAMVVSFMVFPPFVMEVNRRKRPMFLFWARSATDPDPDAPGGTARSRGCRSTWFGF